MCDNIKDIHLLRKCYELAVKEDVEIIEIEFLSGAIRYRDRWSVKDILERDEKNKKTWKEFRSQSK